MPPFHQVPDLTLSIPGLQSSKGRVPSSSVSSKEPGSCVQTGQAASRDGHGACGTAPQQGGSLEVGGGGVGLADQVGGFEWSQFGCGHHCVFELLRGMHRAVCWLALLLKLL
ncbi:hypothetical protein KIL84_002419 [Mauremys mutica]|uniref:Uncharacterized protein n=1 Tax=Mauremys mutica TaxID=74926 RepID=A0A9D3X860_9SAUR|nr:hypothetical protein KIL84_002419 [Mauremys mutica]